MRVSGSAQEAGGCNCGQEGAVFQLTFFHGSFPLAFGLVLVVGIIALSEKAPKMEPCSIAEIHDEPHGKTYREARGELRENERGHYHPFHVMAVSRTQSKPAMKLPSSINAWELLAMVCKTSSSVILSSGPISFVFKNAEKYGSFKFISRLIF